MLAWQVTGADGDLMALDNVNVLEPPANDAGVSAITAPVTTCNLLSSAENIVVTILNSGSSAISGFNVSYKVNNNTPVTAIYSGTINGGTSASYTFTGANAANLSTAGTYSIKAYTSLTGDALATNDTAYTTITVGTTSIPFTMGFESTEDLNGWTVADNNTDGYTWGLYSDAANAHTGTDFIGYSYNTASAADDWFFTKCTTYNSGTNYVLKYYYKGSSALYTERMRVYRGSSNTVAAMTTQLVNLTSITNTTYTLSSTNFTVPSTGTYYLGFQCRSAADQDLLMIDDISVDVVLGIDNNGISLQTEVFPNPASNLITVNSKEKIKQLTLLNIVGSVVYKQLVDANNANINTISLQNGIYFVQIETEQGIVTKKIQIVK